MSNFLLAAVLTVAVTGGASMTIEEFLYKNYFQCRPTDRAYTWIIGSPDPYDFHERFTCGGVPCQRPEQACACEYVAEGIQNSAARVFGAQSNSASVPAVISTATGYRRRHKRGAPLNLCKTEKCIDVSAECLQAYKDANGGTIDVGTRPTQAPPPATTEKPVGAGSTEGVGTGSVDGGGKEVSPLARAGAKVLPAEGPWQDVRLSRSVIPIHQKLMLYPEIEGGTFKGLTDITVDIVDPTEVIYLHKNNLDVTKTRVLSEQGEEIDIDSTFEYAENEYFVIKLASTLAKNQVVLHLEFTGSLTENKMYGWFRTEYKVPDTEETKYVLMAKMTQANARKAFPCFDEPDKKATFEISITHDEKYPIALSNMPLKKEAQKMDNGKYLSEFEVTPKMSTYLVALAVCDYESNTKTSNSGLSITAWTAAHNIQYTEFPLDVAVNAINFYEDYFGMTHVETGVPKIDIVTSPQYPTGAVESWGCITFKEPWFLYKPDITSATQHASTADLVCHELSHSWFGNLVTMSWWDDLWLNEGFATFMSIPCMEHINSDQWSANARFLSKKQFRTMGQDQTEAAHAIRAPVITPADIKQTIITYGKGAGVVRMLHGLLGAETFQAGIKDYIMSHKYGNTETSDLWNALEKAADSNAQPITITNLMDPFLDRPGFPLVHWDSETMTLHQLGRLGSTGGDAELWPVPVTYKILKRNMPDEEDPLVMDGESSQFRAILLTLHLITFTAQKNIEKHNIIYTCTATLPSVTADTAAHVKINLNYTGWYRTNYDDVTWKNLISIMRASAQNNNEPLTAADRSQLLDDAFELAKLYGQSTFLNYSIPIQMMNDYFKHEIHLEPFSVGLSKVKWLFAAVSGMDDAAANMLSKVMSVALKPAYNEYAKETWLSSDQDSYMVRRFRDEVVKAACAYGTAECVNEAARQKSDDMLPLILNTLMMHRGESMYADLLDKLTNDDIDKKQRVSIIQAIAGGVGDKDTVNDFLVYMSKKSDDEYMECLKSLFASQKSRSVTETAVDYFTENYDKIKARFGADNSDFASLSQALAKRVHSKNLQEKLERFFSQTPESGALDDNMKKSISVMKSNVEWATRADITAVLWLNGNLPIFV